MRIKTQEIKNRLEHIENRYERLSVFSYSFCSETFTNDITILVYNDKGLAEYVESLFTNVENVDVKIVKR